MLWQAYETLQEEALFHSQVHGPGHIQRVLLLAALLCWKEGAPEEMVRQVFRAASYHDVGRTFDGYDIYHGARSALRLAAMTGQTGEALVELQAAVTAHSRPDREMASIVASFQPRDLPHAMALTRLLKDADNLDRVRLGDLDPKFLRHDSAKDLVGLPSACFRGPGATRTIRMPSRMAGINRLSRFLSNLPENAPGMLCSRQRFGKNLYILPGRMIQ